jgi:hypothetical protein
MRTAFDYWGRWEQNREHLLGYLDLPCYEDWYDEMLFATRFGRSLSARKETVYFDEALILLANEARKVGNDEIAALLPSSLTS